MNETHLTYCRNAARQISDQIDAQPDLIDDPMIILDRIESLAYSPYPHLTIEHAFDRICAELRILRPDLDLDAI